MKHLAISQQVVRITLLIWLSATAALAVAPPPGTQLADMRTEVPGEFLIQLSSGAFLSPEFRPDLTAQGRTGLANVDRELSGIAAYEIEPVFDDAGHSSEMIAAGLDRIFVVRYAASIDPNLAIVAFQGLSETVYAESNKIARAMLTPNDPTYPSQWAHNNTGQAIRYGGGNVGTPDCDTDTDQAWDLQTGSSSLIVAVIDTGVDTGHPEFSGRVVAGYDYVNNDSNPADDNGHGTCCAGIALGAGNNGQGIAGVAWNVKLMPLKVLNSQGSGSYTAVANGITFAANNGAKILSMSLGGPASSTLLNAVNYAYNAGCAIFAATGNANAGSLDYPAAYSSTIAVGALSPCNERKNPSSCDGENWWGSNYGTGIEFLAPGVRIHTADIRGAGGFGSGDYITDFNGTSSATPHAAGIGALVLSQNPALTNAGLQTVLQSNSDDLGAAGYDTQTGYGRLNAQRAVQNAGNGGGGTPVTIFSENFEINVVPGPVWGATDANSTSGLDYWGDQSSGGGARVHGGSWSAYCADHSNVSGQIYDHNMNANMTLTNAVSVSGYTNVTLSFWLWYQTYNSSDYVAFQYWNGSAWVEQQRWSGSSGAWVNPVYNLTGFTTFQFRYIFFSNSTNRTEGAYVDDIVLSGITSAAAPVGPVAVTLMSEEREALDSSLAHGGVLKGGSVGGRLLFATPNPARAVTALQFTLESLADVRLEMFAADGRRVAILQNGALAKGLHSFTWNGMEVSGHRLSSGVYFAKLTIDRQSAAIERVVLLD